jgi:nitrogen regulatory protein PII
MLFIYRETIYETVEGHHPAKQAGRSKRCSNRTERHGYDRNRSARTWPPEGHKAVYRGTEYSVTLLPKIMIELVLTDDRVEETLKAIITTARTGEIGDGRVFILPVDHGYNIRTGERDTN